MVGLGLVLELRLDDIEWTCRYAADDACCGAGQRVDGRRGEVGGSPYCEFGKMLADYRAWFIWRRRR